MENESLNSGSEHTGYKCTACGGEINFVPGTNSLKCKFCGTVNEIIAKTDANPLEEIPYIAFLKKQEKIGRAHV